MTELDKRDFKILYELDLNSRITINELSKKTNLSRDVVAYRIKNLEKKEIIKKYITIIDFSKLGYQIIRLYLRFQNINSNVENQIIDFFVNQKNIMTVYKIDGQYDLAIGFLVKDIKEYQMIYEKFLMGFKQYIWSKNFSMFLDYIHYDRKYLNSDKIESFNKYSVGSKLAYSSDDKDIDLLNSLKENARITLMELSQKLGLTINGVKYKLKNLEKNKVIVAYKLMIDSKKLGYSYYKVDLDLDDFRLQIPIKQYLSQHPNVIYQDISVGGSDVEFDCEFKNQEEFYNFINELKLRFNKIRTFSYYKAIKIFKYSYIPDNLER